MRRSKTGPTAANAAANVASSAADAAAHAHALRQHTEYLTETSAARTSLLEAFVLATRSIKGASPLRDTFLRLGRANDPSLTALHLSDAELVEFRTWLPPRQAAALRLLAYNPFVCRVELSNGALDDSVGVVLAEVLRRNASITSLNVEGNDLREGGLLALVDSLRDNGTLAELRIHHQKFTVTTPVEEALHELLHSRANTTLCKLGLVVRNDVPRNRINAALFRNLDAARVKRRQATQRELVTTDGDPATGEAAGGAEAGEAAVGEAAAGRRSASGRMVSTSRRPPTRRALSSKLAGFAMGLEGTLAPFDVDGLVADLKSGTAPETTRDGARGMLNLNNDVKFAKCTNEQKLAVVDALHGGACSVVELANVQLGDPAAAAMAAVLRANGPAKIQTLNLEGNLIASAGIEAIAAALAFAPQLTELRLDHQVGGVTSAAAEMELARAVDAHPAIHRLSYSMRQTQARDLVQRATMRNRDKARLERQRNKKLVAAGLAARLAVGGSSARASPDVRAAAQSV